MARKVNPRIRNANEPVEITPQQVQEFKKCAEDVVYFCEHYAKVQHPVKGSINFKLYDYQKEMLRLYQNEMYVVIKSARQSGKCSSFSTRIGVLQMKPLKKNLTEWCIKDLFESVEIGALHQSLSPYSCEIYEDGTDNIKFIEQTSPCDMYIQTPSGMSKIKHTHKTIQYEVWELKTTNHTLKCAEKHIVIDQYDRERFVDSIQLGELIQTEDGLESVVSVMKLDIPSENMYDIELDDGVHLYYTDGIVSHNSITSAIYLLWYAMFHFEKTILIASNKNAGAMEMIHRIRFAYEELPYWLKAGVTEDGWNKHTLCMDNGSRIISTATSEDSGRGLSISKLFLDEFAFVPPAVQSAFFTSIMPTLATGGSCIMTSTPNGDNDMFAQIWRSATAGSTVGLDDEEGKGGAEFSRIGFAPLEVRWDQPPGRDEKFKQKQIGLIGLLRWQQEYECQFISSDALLISSTVSQMIEKRAKVYAKDIQVINDITFWEKIKSNETYLISIDPSTGSGKDFSVMTVVHFPSMVQVAEYRNSTTSSPDLYRKLKWVIAMMERIGSHCYFSVENNGVGEGIIALFMNDEQPPLFAEFVSDSVGNRLGMNTNGRTKIKSCIAFKEMVEADKITIKSSVTPVEMKSYIRKKGSFEAQPGGTDDCISSWLIIIRILEEISTYEQDAFDKLYTYGSDYDVNTEEYDENDPDSAPVPILF